MPDSRPNLITIVADTLRTAYMGCYGNPDVHTPNLDVFARQMVTIYDFGPGDGVKVCRSAFVR